MLDDGQTGLRPGPGLGEAVDPASQSGSLVPDARADDALPAASVLLALADVSVRATLGQALSERGMRFMVAHDASRARRILALQSFDAVVFDSALDGCDPLDFCREAPGLGATPIVLLTLRDDPAERVLALEMGADDALWRDAPPNELVARIRALRRRAARLGEAARRGGGLRSSFDGWTLDIDTRRIVAPGGATGWLSDANARLLLAFIETPGRCMDRKAVAAMMAQRDCKDAPSTDWGIRIHRLRQALRALAPDQELIRNVRGRGYLFDADVRSSEAAR